MSVTDFEGRFWFPKYKILKTLIYLGKQTISYYGYQFSFNIKKFTEIWPVLIYVLFFYFLCAYIHHMPCANKFWSLNLKSFKPIFLIFLVFSSLNYTSVTMQFPLNLYGIVKAALEDKSCHIDFIFVLVFSVTIGHIKSTSSIFSGW